MSDIIKGTRGNYKALVTRETGGQSAGSVVYLRNLTDEEIYSFASAQAETALERELLFRVHQLMSETEHLTSILNELERKVAHYAE